MKVFIALDNPWKEPNPYTYTLIDGILAKYKDVEFDWGRERFWNDSLEQFDIVHIMFPDWLCEGFSSFGFVNRIASIKKTKCKLVATCHNIKPHTYESDLYDILYSSSDLIIHLGEYSKSLFSSIFPGVKHVLIPHHVYDKVYYNQYSRKEALSRLNLDGAYKYVLSFGDFRKEEERQLVAYIARKLKSDNISILAPTFEKIYNRRNPKYWLLPKIHYWRYKFFAHNLVSSCGYVSDELLPYYYAACDVTLIHRLEILNSGSLPMGFFMKHVVVGPDCGNVGHILQDTGNPFFDQNDWDTAVAAIRTAFELSMKGKGIENFNRAMIDWNTQVVSSMLYECYKSLILGK